MTASGESGGSDVDVVIVNWNTGGLLRQALASIASSERQGLGSVRAVVVDNASADDSLSRIEDAGVPLRVIRNDRNRGFAAACNQGASGSAADYLLFLNPDMTLFADTLRRAVGFMDSERGAGVGIAGVRLEDEDGAFTHSCARFPSLGVQAMEVSGLPYLAPDRFHAGPMSESECREDRPVDHVAGAFFLMRRELFESMGGFDERFFVYAEECDLAFRAKRAGWPSHYLAGIRARHAGGRSSEQVKPQRLFYLLRSRTQYFDKHHPGAPAAIHVALTCLLEPLSRLLHSLIPSTASGPADIIGGYRRYFGFLLRRGRSRTLEEHGRC
jgi:N-acetylglucosaminyl-diphospho-decaprenol L-rhamnosyltransferase